MTDRKRHFIDTYVATFLATRAALHYEEWCASDQHDRLTSDQPIEDVVFQALETWGLYVADKTLLEPRE
jgi:hypothetical protein